MPKITSIPFTKNPRGATQSRIVKGVRIDPSIESSSDVKKFNSILRRRHLGILDEQTILKRNTKQFDGVRGIQHYFIEEFTTRNAKGFQCVARKQKPKQQQQNTSETNDENLWEKQAFVNDFETKFCQETNSVDYNITLRHIPYHEISNVIRAVHNIQTNGFLNYYSGTEFFAPHVRQGLLPGLSLLQGNYAAAFELLCRAPRMLKQQILNRHQQTTTNSQNNNNTNPSAMISLLRDHSQNDISNESNLAKELRKHRPVELNDALCRTTLETVLGVNGCSKMVSEFVAIVWNECVSRRVRQYGTRSILEGDFVDDTKTNDENGEFLLRQIEREEIINNNNDNLDIHNVLLPTLGHSTYFPNPSWKEFNLQTLRRYGIVSLFEESELLLFQNEEQEEFLKHACQTIFPSLNFAQLPLWNVSGEYRRMIEYPRNFSWKLLPDYDLSDREIGFRFKKSLQEIKEERRLWKNNNNAQKQQDEENSLMMTNQENKILSLPEMIGKNGKVEPSSSVGTLQKLEMKFSLPVHSSPWMMLREMCKMDRHIFDEGLRSSDYLENPNVNVKNQESERMLENEKAAARRRIYKNVARKLTWGRTAGPFPEAMEHARLLNSVFHHHGIGSRSLLKSPKGWGDIKN